MNVGELRKLSLKLTNSYSADGVELAPSDIADHKLAFVDYLNTAQAKFSERDKIEAILTIIQVGSDVGYILNPLPTDFIGVNKIIFVDSSDDYKHRILFTDYTIEKGNIVIDGVYDGTFTIYYEKIPTPLEIDTDVPEIRSMYHSYLAYFCAGTWLFTTGSQQSGIVLLNIFDSYLNEMKPNTGSCNDRIMNSTGW